MRNETRTVTLNSAFVNLEFETTASTTKIWVVMILWLLLWSAVYTGVMVAVIAAVNAMGANVPYWAGVVLGWGAILLVGAIKGD